MKRHEASKAHQAAAQHCAGKAAIAMAPPHSEFQAALTCMRQGGSARQGGVSSDRKSRLRFALSEAFLRRARQQLARARCVALFRDERKGRLLVRYRACLDDLTVVSGVLGLNQAEGSGAGLTKVTMILEEFATPFHGLPRKCSAPSSDEPKTVQAALRDKVSILVSDAAANELLSSEMLRGRRADARSGLVSAEFPNVRVVGRDAAHASTRLLRRPLCHHDVLKSVLAEFVPQSDSFAQKVFHSDIFSSWWRA